MNVTFTNKNLNAKPAIAKRSLQSCKKLLGEIDRAKKLIATEFRGIVERNQQLFNLALNEAEALAWQTDHPQLFFPALAVEKVERVAAWETRQRFMQQPRLAFAEAA